MADDFGSNEWIVEQQRRRFQEDPASVSPAWREYFGGAPTQTQTQTPTSQQPGASPEERVASSEQPAARPESPTVEEPPEEIVAEELKGGPALIAERMDASRELPTATSVRSFPAKLLEVNRRIVNNQLNRLLTGKKVSFTHLIGWAVVRATAEFPVMNTAFEDRDGTPHRITYPGLNLGLAMDIPRKDGSRMLLVPNVKGADRMDFRQYWEAYEDVVARVRGGSAGTDDFAETTMTLTNPGTVGTVQSVPRLMPGQGAIIGVGAIKYPPEWEGADPQTLAATGVGRVITMTSTYDHRIIQGAESGAFLARINELLLGADGFYEDVFSSMQIPYVPAQWAPDQNPPPGSRPWAEKQARVFQLINMYRVRGHLIADLDPLRLEGPAIHPELDPLTYGITIWDLDREFATGGLAGKKRMRVGEILGALRDAYGRTVGVEYMHIQEPDQKAWIQSQIEGISVELTDADKERILRKLTEAEVFETFLHTKYVGQKRFSLQGSESLIPLLDEILNQAAREGMEDVTVGMAHRGRLNVLANTIGKSYADIFREFEGATDPQESTSSGDVKYHLGAKGSHTTPEGTSIAVEVVANPSHLEAVDPVLEGVVRAKQDERGDGAVDLIFPLLIHGDAAFSGQGVVAETLNLSQLDGYHTGGTVHVVVNNQVGFTTSADEARSSHYATDVAKTVQAPIFHVNGDDVEAVVRVARLAFGFRQAFHKDVVIDLLCYRRYGHNEGDDPSYTQPSMYRVIEDRPSARNIYMQRLEARGDMTSESGEGHRAEFRALLDEAMAETKSVPPRPAAPVTEREPVVTAADKALLDRIAAALTTTPEGFTVHPKLERLISDRRELFVDGWVDWALAEALALGTVAIEGHPVRFAGEDTSRGTFSHRHATLVDNVDQTEWTPLLGLTDGQTRVDIIDSMLSEFAAMGFEYGYSIHATDALVAWEAQFGDFANGAQVVIDQFLAPGEDKWDQQSSLVLMLPHGFEGQGPEHSSARIERFLQACAEDNMRIAMPSTPSQYFHLLRRQPLDPDRKPLVLFTPKSLLRARRSFSEVTELHDGAFQPVLSGAGPASGATKVVLCSGKFYYDLATGLEASERTDISLLRLERFYPFPSAELETALGAHPGAQVVWAQEEPANMGAWHFVSRMASITEGITRPASASPATGNSRIHVAEQQDLVKQALS